MSLIDHISLVVSNYERSKAFYEKALAPLGVKPIMEFGKACGFGRGQKPDFWIGQGPTSFQTQDQLKLITPTHVAFRAESRQEVDAFYEAAIAAGGRDFGKPGPRPIYHPGYYGGFVPIEDASERDFEKHGAARSTRIVEPCVQDRGRRAS